MATVPHERCVLRLLTATKDLVMEDDKERAFTAGETYRVKSMHPIAEPAYVVLVDDQGADHKMAGEHIREFFGTRTKPQNVELSGPEGPARTQG